MDTHISYLTAAVAIVAVYIAYQQWRTNYLRLKHDLYDKRYLIYKATQHHLSKIMVDGDVDDKGLFEFASAMQDARFLMDDATYNYLDGIYKKSLEMQTASSEYKHLPVGPERSALVKKKSEVLKYLIHELSNLHNVFGKFLKLGR